MRNSILNDDEAKSCCFTGYRPSKFPFSLYEKSAEYIRFENQLLEGILTLADEDCRIFYSGMAMGFDIIAAEAVLLLKNAYKTPLKLIAVVPFPEQKETFSPLWKKRYEKVLSECDCTITLSDKYYQGCYQKRNEYMVDNSDYVLTWYDGKSGGTKNTMRYAEKKQRFILNVNRPFQALTGIQTSLEIL